MKNSLRSLASRTAIGALALGLATTASSGFAATFASTTDASAWTVSTAVLNGAGDGQFASFLAAGGAPATAVTVPGRTDWIANNASGTNGYIGDWTFFTFQQSFTLTAQEAATYDLQFQWAADDSGEGFAARGSWTPKFSLNGGALIDGAWSSSYTYDYGLVTDVAGFHEGLNTLTFYVEGNGVTDGMALKTLSFTSAVPEPGSLGMLAAGLGLMGALVRRAKRNAG
jgi:hypothetical protein